VVIVRVGENAKGWEESALPNAVLKGIPDDGGEARDATSEMKGQQLGDRP
jgi:hypothetical protein